MLKIVIAGCGGISNFWFQALQGLENVLAVGVVDLNEQAALQRKTDFQLTSAQVGTELSRSMSGQPFRASVKKRSKSSF